MSAKAGAVVEAEVVLQDGGNQTRKAWVSGEGCEVEGVLAIAPFVLALLFCGCDLAAPGGAMRRPIPSGARKK